MSDAKTPRKPVDWEAVERDYRTGTFTDRELGAKYSVSHTAVQKRARVHGWEKPNGKEAARQRAVTLRAPELPDRAGFVYAITFEVADARYVKIGRATHLDSRLKAHQTSLPFEARVAIGYFVDDARAEEATLHAMFSDKRIRGEWFQLERADLARMAERALLL